MSGPTHESSLFVPPAPRPAGRRAAKDEPPWRTAAESGGGRLTGSARVS